MSQNIYDEFLIETLKKNPNIKNVSPKSILFRPEFKLKAVKEYEHGKKPAQIFCEHGFDLKLVDKDYPRHCLRRWRQVYKNFGEEGLLTDRRSKHKKRQISLCASTGRSS